MSEYTSPRGVFYQTTEDMAHGAVIDCAIPGTVGHAQITMQPGNTWYVASDALPWNDDGGFEPGNFDHLRDAMSYVDRELSDAVGRHEAQRILDQQAKVERQSRVAGAAVG